MVIKPRLNLVKSSNFCTIDVMRKCLRVTLAIAMMGMLGCVASAEAATTLDLSVSGTASDPPDALTAQLSAQASADTAAEAQDKLNVIVAKALQDSQAVKELTVTTSAYTVSPVYPQRTTWEARQDFVVTLSAPPANETAKSMLALLGQLQQSGLMLESLTGTLTAKAKRQAEQAAITDAVKRMKAQSEAVAKALGDQSGSITRLHLNASNPILPVFERGMTMAVTAPSVRAAPVTERVTLSGTVLLTRHNR